jgi:hypothetical protein
MVEARSTIDGTVTELELQRDSCQRYSRTSSSTHPYGSRVLDFGSTRVVERGATESSHELRVPATERYRV